MASVRYLVDDVDTAITFYEKLGFNVAERWGPPFAQLKREDLTLWLSGPGTSARRAMPDGREPSPGGWNRLVIEVVELERVVSNLRSTGVKFRNELTSGPGGVQILVDDPSGNPIELFEARR